MRAVEGAGYSGTQTAKIVGITYRQLDYWARTDLLKPSLAEATGSGSRRQYSYRDLLELRIIKTLLDAGIKLESVRDVFKNLRETVGADISSANIVISGTTSVVLRDERRADRADEQGPRRPQHPRPGRGQGWRRRRDRVTAERQLRARPAPARRMTLERSPLDAVHRALGARMVPFGGWEMPLEYPTGTIAEHLACRRDAVVFDVSHLGSVRVEGADAFDTLQRQLTNDLGKISPGRAQYTHLLDPDDASVLDDIIVWWHPGRRRTGTVRRDAQRLEHRSRASPPSGDVETTHERAVLAVQGPPATERLATIWPEAAAIGRFRVGHADWDGVDCTVAGTGYTGEAGCRDRRAGGVRRRAVGRRRRRRRAAGRARRT